MDTIHFTFCYLIIICLGIVSLILWFAYDREYDTNKRILEKLSELMETNRNLSSGCFEELPEEDLEEVKTEEESDDYKFEHYVRELSEGCLGWTDDAGSNLAYLVLQRNMLNKKLKKEGRLYLNDVYDLLGFPRTVQGERLGWISGENSVLFGLSDPCNRDFVDGKRNSAFLIFNVRELSD